MWAAHQNADLAIVQLLARPEVDVNTRDKVSQSHVLLYCFILHSTPTHTVQHDCAHLGRREGKLQVP